MPDYEPLFAALQRDLASRTPEALSFSGYRQAAVLVPILLAPGGLHLLFTVRSSTLAHHAGQIAFPGGRLEPGETLAQAALRETFEETGLMSSDTRILGELQPLPSPAKYLVTPVVGIVPWPQPLKISAAEVAEVFTVPLADLLNLTPRQEERHLQGQRRIIYYYAHQSLEGERLIWGLTGNIVADLLAALRPHLRAKTQV